MSAMQECRALQECCACKVDSVLLSRWGTDIPARQCCCSGSGSEDGEGGGWEQGCPCRGQGQAAHAG